MADYSKINLLKIESSSQTDGLEARFGRKYLNSKELGISLFSYAPNFTAEGAHSHKVQEEVYVVAHGSGSILLDNEVVALNTWDVVRVAPQVVRAFKAGPDGLDIIAVGGTKPAEGDGVRQTAQWPTQ